MVRIHEKITALLEQRRLKKRDLARALGVSPQTATDICKGRSAITLPHLRNLVAFFGVRADFWLDEVKPLPEAGDGIDTAGAAARLADTGLLQVADPGRLLRVVRAFLSRHRTEFLTANPGLTAEERTALGLAEPGSGMVGRIADLG
ncbi:MAG: helix-turn-helix domain-containing protein [Planctomycetota bacterium]